MHGSDNMHGTDMAKLPLISKDPEVLKGFVADSIRSLGIEGLRCETEQGCKKAWLQFANNSDAQFAQLVIPEGITAVEQSE